MIRKLALLLFSLLLVASLRIAAQNGGSFADKLYFGGNFGLGVFSDKTTTSTFFNVSPMVGYRFTDRFVAGPGIIYQYLNYRDSFYKQSIDFNNYGAKLFARYALTESLFAHVEPEFLNREYLKGYDSNGKAYKARIDVFSFFVGGGYRQRIGDRSSFDILMLYNLNDNIYSPYSNPILRVGFGVGF